MHFFLDFLISAFAFWISETWAFQHLKYVILVVFGGSYFPLDFLPDKVQPIFFALPFKFVFYIPVSYINGKRNFMENGVNDFFQLAAWTVVFILIGKFLWRKGIKKYEAYGN